MNRAIPIASLLALIVVSWNTWWGDPMIYLSYAGPFQFNPHEFSASMTSPVWHLLTFWMGPVLFKAFSAIVAMRALLALLRHGVVAGALAFPMIFFGVMGYETALAVWIAVEMYEGRNVGWLLPLIRPESIPLLVWAYWRDYRGLFVSLVPFALWAVTAYTAGDGLTSVTTRIDDFSVRYLAVYWVYGALMLSEQPRLAVASLLLGGALMFRTMQGAYRDSGKGWDYDTIAMRNVAEYVNARYDSVTVGAYEIQIRRHLKPSIRVVSVEGLAGRGNPSVWIATDRNDNGTRTVRHWDINAPGFIKWAEVRE